MKNTEPPSKVRQVTDFTIVLAFVALLMVGMALSFMFLFPPDAMAS